MTHEPHHHNHHHHNNSSSNLKLALILNITFTLLEIIGGFWTNSIAILSDAVHDFGDSLSLAFALYFDKVSKQGRTPENTYGYRRYSLLGGLITGIVLLIGLVFVLWHAVFRLFSPEPVNASGMMLIAVVGVIFNGAAVLKVRHGTSLTEKIVSWHLLEDTLGWIAVLVGAGVMMIWDLPIIDPLLSIGISVFILWNVVKNLRKVFDVLLQRVPDLFDIEKFEAAMLDCPKVTGIHSTHSWSMDGETHVLTTHLVMACDATRDEIMQAKMHVRQNVDPALFEHLTIDVELEDEKCVMSD